MLCVPSLAGAEEAASTGVTVSGFIDASLSTSFTGTDIDKKITYGVDQVELDFSSSPAAGLTVRTDLNVFPAGGAIDAEDRKSVV